MAGQPRTLRDAKKLSWTSIGNWFNLKTAPITCNQIPSNDSKFISPSDKFEIKKQNLKEPSKKNDTTVCLATVS